MKSVLKSILIFTMIVFISCSGYGDKVIYDGTEIYYKEGISEEMANKTGEFLKEMGFTDGTTKSVQLTKEDVYNFRMVVQEEFAKDSTMDVNFTAMGMLLSKDIFGGEDINFQLCDNTFKTLRTIPIKGFEVKD